MSTPPEATRSIRWWPAILILIGTVGFIVVCQSLEELPFQMRNMRSMGAGMIGFVLLNLWWLGFSRAPWVRRLAVFAGQICSVALFLLVFRMKGVSGDLVPIFEFRWNRGYTVDRASVGAIKTQLTNAPAGPNFPQFLGPTRTGVLEDTHLDPDWEAHPPKVLWRQPVGTAWSGFMIAGPRAITQEQSGTSELVTCRDLATGALQWAFADNAHYLNPIGGEGPRATPTLDGKQVYVLGATGRLHCLDLETGKALWTRDITQLAGAKMPEWGYAGSPLVLFDHVIVCAGGPNGKSLIALRKNSGELAWAGGDAGAGYSSPFLTTLAGVPQILSFNAGRVTAHAVSNGKVLWEYPWGVGMPHVAMPVVTGPDTVVISSGYGVGAGLLQLKSGPDGGLAVTNLWLSKKMKAKFSNPYARQGYLYGLDDGIFACVDLKDGSQRWKEGRYGHGQGLLVGEHYLLMAESGELVLLRPTPEGPGELHRMKLFSAKTWNPIALAGSTLLVRTDAEAVCLQLALKP